MRLHRSLHYFGCGVWISLLSWALTGEAIAEQEDSLSLASTPQDISASLTLETIDTSDPAVATFSLDALRADIVQNLPADISFRLPSELYLMELLELPESITVEVDFATAQLLDPLGLRANLSICYSSSDLGADLIQPDCIAGTFVAISANSPFAQDEMAAHLAIGYPFGLTPNIHGYYREIQRDGQAYSSVMWAQDGQFYRVEFPLEERRNMLLMASEMANTAPIGQPQATDLPTPLEFDNAEPVIQLEGIVTPDPAAAIADDEAADAEIMAEVTEPIDVARLRFRNSSLWTDEEIRNLLLEQQIDEPNADLEQMALWLTQAYLNRGYITSSVQKRGDNTLVFTEGRLADEIPVLSTETDAESPLADYIRSRIEQVAETPLNLNRLEDALRLLRIDPLFDNIEATLSRADEAADDDVDSDGQSPVDVSELTIKVDEAEPITYGIAVNNDAAASLGAEQVEVGFSYANFIGQGDRLIANYARTFEGGLDYLTATYRVPVSPTDGTLQFSAEYIVTEVVEAPFDDLNIEGETYRYGLLLRQPLIRNPREEFALSLGFTYTSGQTFFLDRLPTPFGFGPDEDGFSRTSVLSFGQDYVYREPDGAWAINSQFNLGLLIFDATENDSPIPDGQFFSWQGLVQRVQRLGNDHLLVAQIDAQLTPDSLLPSESFSIGGINSVRGYRSGARSGDNGLHFYIEDRFTVRRDGAGRPVLTLRPFLDLGAVWNHPDNPNTIEGPTWLLGTGLGITIENLSGVEGLSLRADYGVPLIHLDDAGDDLQDHGFYFGINYNSDFGIIDHSDLD